MAGACARVVGSWYWIYWIGPFCASLAVAEVTEWISMDVSGGSSDDAPSEIKATPSVDEGTVPPVDSP
jgi:hypothetical protein